MTTLAVARRATRAVLTISLTLAVLVVAASAGATTVTVSPETAPDGQPYITLDTRTASVSSSSAFSIHARIVVDAPTSYLESRLQIHNPGGRLLYQKTEVRNEVETGTVTIDYQRELDDLDFDPGVYPMELRVRSDSQGVVREWVLTDELLVYGPQTQAIPLALVVHVSSTPAFDPEGRFVVDPGRFDDARHEVSALAGYILEHPDAHITLALPPMLAEEWARIADGYEESGPEGILEVTADEPVPVLYAETLARLQAAVGTGRLELSAVPYADPDLGGMQASDRMIDLSEHFARGMSALILSLESSPSAGTAFSGGIVPASTLPALVEREIEYTTVSWDSLASLEATPSSGLYTLTDTASQTDDPAAGVRGLLIDGSVTDALAAGTDDAIVRAAFDRAISEEATMPLIAVIEMGPGRPATVESLRACTEQLEAIPWIDMVTAQEAALATPTATLELAEAPRHPENAPVGYWDEVASARSRSAAFLSSVGINDPDAQAANDASLIAQSRTWSGPDGSWNSADRALGFAAAAKRQASAVLDGVSIAAQDITLSSAQGEVPVSLTNASDKNLLLTIRTRASGMALPEGTSVSVTARPQDTYLTVPVDLQSSLSGTLDIEVWAGDVMLDSRSVTVRASFLDRLALVGSVSAILVGLLLFIRHRARTARPADTIDTDD